ncbi:MAG: hypothetical protein KY476_17260 [Planctomycetes bacterium]|nr:hypothetical protein [Planctomycetota bacterium]
MFGFLFERKRQEVRRALASRINLRCADGIRHADRGATRSPFCEILWLMPDDGDRGEAFEEMTPVVGKDISTQGIAIVHNQPVTAKRVLVALDGQFGPSFIRSTVEHSTPLGHGFYQIGLHPDEVVQLEAHEVAAWRRRCEEFASDPPAHAGRLAPEAVAAT